MDISKFSNIIRITPDLERTKSIIKMAEANIQRIKETDASRFASGITKDYYDVIRELISAIMLADGYKTYGEGAHKSAIGLVCQKYELKEHETRMIEDLRILRNKISYDGYFVDEDYLNRNSIRISDIIKKLRKIANKKIK